jgi:hypothetical protein
MKRLRGIWVWSALAVVAVLVGVVWLWPTPQPSDPAGDAGPEPVGSVAPNLVIGRPDPGGHHHEEQWTEQPWRPVAVGFARDFADPGRGVADWRERVGRWVTDYLADQYRDTAAYRIPVARLERVAGPKDSGQAVTAIATYDTGLTLILSLEVFPEAGWKVTRVTPSDTIGLI